MKLEAILQKLGLLQPGKIMYIGGSDVLQIGRAHV